MSKSVIYSLTPTYATFSGNVESIKTSTTTVADESDLNALEARLSNRINALQQSINRLDSLFKKLTAEIEKMPDDVKNEVLKLSQQQKMVLDNEYRKLIDDIAKKCDDVSAILKK